MNQESYNNWMNFGQVQNQDLEKQSYMVLKNQLENVSFSLMI